jgi:prevent-host-death family protein
MKVYTFSEARQKFASVLDDAQKEGAVRITRRDGRSFTVQPAKESHHALRSTACRTASAARIFFFKASNTTAGSSP